MRGFPTTEKKLMNKPHFRRKVQLNVAYEPGYSGPTLETMAMSDERLANSVKKCNSTGAGCCFHVDQAGEWHNSECSIAP